MIERVLRLTEGEKNRLIFEPMRHGCETVGLRVSLELEPRMVDSFGINKEEAQALLEYLQVMIPQIRNGE